MSHAYSIISAFTMTYNSTTNKFFLMRNPWGYANYNSDWHKTDTRWSDALVAQVPHGVDPRTD